MEYFYKEPAKIMTWMTKKASPSKVQATTKEKDTIDLIDLGNPQLTEVAKEAELARRELNPDKFISKPSEKKKNQREAKAEP